jgi:hypothetical protein
MHFRKFAILAVPTLRYSPNTYSISPQSLDTNLSQHKCFRPSHTVNSDAAANPLKHEKMVFGVNREKGKVMVGSGLEC